MRYTVLTSFSPAGWELYGERFVDTFNRFWRDDVKLIVAWEGQPPRPDLNGFDLLEYEPLRAFLERHSENPVMRGLKPHPDWPWGDKFVLEGYNFKFDAVKFCHKVFAIAAAANYVEDGKFYWLDGDVATHSDVPLSLLDLLLPETVSLSYLARPGYTHSECGFIGFNLDRLETRAFITAYEDAYASDYFVGIETWHDSHVFDHLVAKRKPAVMHIPHSSRAQPFDLSILGQYMTHYKGPRKHGRQPRKTVHYA